MAIFTWELKPGTTRTGVTQVMGQISPINFERLNVQNKADAKTQKSAVTVNNAVHAQTELSIDCDPQVNLVENAQDVKNLQTVRGIGASPAAFSLRISICKNVKIWTA